MLRRLSLLCLFGICVQLMWAQATLSVYQPYYYLETPDEITVAVNIKNVFDDMRAYQVVFNYDPEYVQIEGPQAFHEGSFLSSNGLTTWLVKEGEGMYAIGCSILGLTNGSVGSGTLFTVTLRPRRNTLVQGTDLSLSSIVLKNVVNNPIPAAQPGKSNIVINAFNAYANIKVFLEGPYLGSGQMRHDLTAFLPLHSPYNDEVLDQFPDVSPHYIVDWMLMELRAVSNGAALHSVNMFLLENGYLVSTDGTNLIPMDYVPDTQYYIVLRHRNHLGIMSAQPHAFSISAENPAEIDLTVLDSVWGGNVSGAKQLEQGVLGMVAGDGDHDERIYPSDNYIVWVSQSGMSGYKEADYNLDGNVFPNDRVFFWQANSGKSSQIP